MGTCQSRPFAKMITYQSKPLHLKVRKKKTKVETRKVENKPGPKDPFHIAEKSKNDQDDTNSMASFQSSGKTRDDKKELIIHNLEPNVANPSLTTDKNTNEENDTSSITSSQSYGKSSTENEGLNTQPSRMNSMQSREGSSSVGLDEIDECRKEEGALASNVVHIELPFGKPIEEVYDGVHSGRILGSGVSGLVRVVKHRATGIEYAVKSLDIGLIETKEGLEQLRQEIYIMCQLDHPNIVRLEEVYESASEIYLVQELCKGGELFDRLDEQPDYHYTEQQCARLVKQMLSSVRYIHSKDIIHRDLKLENFLFSTKDEDSELKMIDFGLSKHFKLGELQHESVGTPYTAAPEVILGNYDERCDLWAVGVITYLLLSGDPPFGGCGGPESLITVRNNILQGKFRFEPQEIWCNVSQQAKDFISSLLVTDPQQRLTAREAQKSLWLKEWAVKETKANGGNKLNPNVANALVTFKEYSDMRKLLCEVLSFTLVPDQIQDLRKEFEKMDTDGSGEVSLAALKKVLVENVGSGALGTLAEDEVEDIFNAMRVSKTETYIHWHEFIAASLSQCKVDDRNLRLAFDRLDSDHKGYITCKDVLNIMGNDGLNSEESYRKIFFEGLSDAKCTDSRIFYEDFKLLMKGQIREHLHPIEGADIFKSRGKSMFRRLSSSACKQVTAPEISVGIGKIDEISEEANIVNSNHGVLDSVPESSNGVEKNGMKEEEREQADNVIFERHQASPPSKHAKYKFLEVSRSVNYDNGEDSDGSEDLVVSTDARCTTVPTQHEHTNKKSYDLIKDNDKTPLVVNRNLYKTHRHMRLGVLDACKRFEEQQLSRVLQEQKQQLEAKGIRRGSVGAGLVMRRGHSNMLSTDAIRKILHERQHEQQNLLSKANKLSGRGKRRNKKTVSDLSSMLSNPLIDGPMFNEGFHGEKSRGKRRNKKMVSDLSSMLNPPKSGPMVIVQ